MKIVKISKKLITGTDNYDKLTLLKITEMASTNCINSDCGDCPFIFICGVTRRLIQKS